MARKSQKTALRSRGRPKSTVVPPSNTPKRRGRPAKAKAKAPIEQPAAVGTTSKRGRRSLAVPQPSVEEASVSKKRVGRPSKAALVAPVAQEASAPPKRRGRPPKNTLALNLNHVAGPARISKSAPKRTSTLRKASLNTRLDPRMRSRLRTRVAPPHKIKEELTPQPAKRRGRPPKAVPKASSPKKAWGRKAAAELEKDTTAKSARASKPTKTAANKASKTADTRTTRVAITKPKTPRKKRGHTLLEVPDKFVTQVRQYLQDLHDAESLPTPVEDGVEENEPEARADGDCINVVVEEVVVTSAPADREHTPPAEEVEECVDKDDEQGADAKANAEANPQEYDIDGAIVQNVNHEELNEHGANVGVEINIQETVQIEHVPEDVNEFDQALENMIQAENLMSSSLVNDEEVDLFFRDAEVRPEAAVIFG